ncbi:MAG: ethanolamine utilization protein EutJ [Brooklawnia sp.]|jgi:ethanolamine utilization protein EutJ
MTARAPLKRFAQLVRTGQVDPAEGELRLGVDLGTANIVLAVTDSANRPVAGGWRHASVVRDGIVVDWLGAVQAVQAIRSQLESSLRTRFERAAVAVPPGMDAGTIKVFTNVLEACNLDPDEVVDEPVAAATALGMTDGAVIDIGHGTTGVSVMRERQVVHSTDEATGGHHMTLVLAGALKIDYDQAEKYKVNKKNEAVVFVTVRPTLEKMATIAAEALQGHDPEKIVLVGGASSFPGAPGVFSDVLGRKVIRPGEPLFPTPLGTAMRRQP